MLKKIIYSAIAGAAMFQALSASAADCIVAAGDTGTAVCRMMASDTNATDRVSIDGTLTVSSASANDMERSAIYSGSGSDNYWSFEDISVSGSASTTVAGAYGIYLVKFTATNGLAAVTKGISIAGSLKGTGGGIYLNDFDVAGITVGPAGLIDGGGGFGIRFVDASRISGSLVNNGTISSGNWGIHIPGTSSITGAIVNHGVIFGGGSGALGVGGLISGGITNQAGGQIIGGIQGGSIVDLWNSGQFTNKSASTIADPANAGNPVISAVRNFTQTATGVMQMAASGIAMAGTDFSRLTVAGNAAVDGVLHVDVKSTFVASTGTVIPGVVLTTGTLTGNFASVTDNTGRYRFTPVVNGKAIDLHVTETVAVGGTVTGLATGQTVELLNNGVDASPIGANGGFTMGTPIDKDASYAVTVGTQPAGQTCTVTNGAGTATADVTSVQVACVTNTYAVGGAVSGLATGQSVVLHNNGGDALTLSANGSFSFATKLIPGDPYAVTVQTQPAGQICSVSNGGGTVGTADISDVVVSCLNTYTITTSAGTGGTLSCDPNPVPHGSSSICAANPSPGYTFSAFGGACSGTTCTLTQVQSAMTVTAQFKANQTITISAPAAQTFSPEGKFPVSALATSGLPVAITSGTLGVCTVSGTLVTMVSAGTCTLVANQSGDANTNPAPPATHNVAIGVAPQTLTFPAQTPASHDFVKDGSFAIKPLASSAEPNSNQPIRYSSLTTGVCTVSGTSVTMVSAGTCTLAADQDGNADYTAATQATQNVTIGKASQALTFPAQTPASHDFVKDGSFAIKPPASSAEPNSNQPIRYSSLTTGVCTVSGTSVTMVSAGTCTLAADQDGNADYAAATQATQNVTIGKASQTLTFPAQTPASHDFVKDGSFAISPLATSDAANSGGPITYSSLTAGVCTVNGTEVGMVAPGACILAADQAGNDDFDAAQQVTQTVALNAQTVFSGTTVPLDPAQAGPATASFTGGGTACRFETEGGATAFVASPAAPPAGKTLPQGMFRFTLVGCDASPVSMRITWPELVSGYTKYGKEDASAAASSYFAPTALAIDGHTVTFTVQDGQLGDDDWTVNGELVDPSGPTADAAGPVPVADVTPIPTLGEWSLVLLGLLAAALGMGRLRRA